MKLNKYDNKCIRLETTDGEIYEGICTFNGREYNYHEYGRDEDSLQMSYTIFYKSYIKKVKIIDSFSSAYGKLEELVIEDDLDLVEEVLDSEEDISIYRLLQCLKDKCSSFPKHQKEELTKLLENLIKYNQNEDIKKEATKLLNNIK